MCLICTKQSIRESCINYYILACFLVLIIQGQEMETHV